MKKNLTPGVFQRMPEMLGEVVSTNNFLQLNLYTLL